VVVLQYVLILCFLFLQYDKTCEVFRAWYTATKFLLAGEVIHPTHHYNIYVQYQYQSITTIMDHPTHACDLRDQWCQVTPLYTCVPRYTKLTRAWYAIHSRQYFFAYSSKNKMYYMSSYYKLDIYLNLTFI
jgi:hypothetical protein